MRELIGRRFKGIGLASKLGYPTINIRINGDIECGIYKGMTNLGSGVIYVVGRGVAECHIIDKKIDEIDVGEEIHITNLERIDTVSTDGLLGVMRYGLIYKRIESLLWLVLVLVWLCGVMNGLVCGLRWRKAST
jgi:hypothetical protein